jgi:hypothetical protein
MTYMRIKIKVIYKPIFRMITEVVMNRIQEEEDFSTDTKELIKTTFMVYFCHSGLSRILLVRKILYES